MSDNDLVSVVYRTRSVLEALHAAMQVLKDRGEPPVVGIATIALLRTMIEHTKTWGRS